MKQSVSYDIVGDRVIIRYEDGTEERLTSFQIRQRATWKDGKFQVWDVLKVWEVPVE